LSHHLIENQFVVFVSWLTIHLIAQLIRDLMVDMMLPSLLYSLAEINEKKAFALNFMVILDVFYYFTYLAFGIC